MRDKISEIRYGQTAWEFSFDSAIIFQLEKAAIAITKYPHSELFLITHAPTIEQLDVITRFDEWEDEIGVEHTSTRATIPIHKLLTPVPEHHDPAPGARDGATSADDPPS